MYVYEPARPFTVASTGALQAWRVLEPCECNGVPAPGEQGGYCAKCGREWTVIEDSGGSRRQTVVGCWRYATSSGPDGDDRRHDPHGPPYGPPDARGRA